MSDNIPIVPLDLRAAWSVREYVALFGISRATVYNMISDKELPTVKKRGRRLIPNTATAAGRQLLEESAAA